MKNDYLDGVIEKTRIGKFYIGMSFEEFLRYVDFSIIITPFEEGRRVWDENNNMFFMFTSDDNLGIIKVMDNYNGKYEGKIGINDVICDFWEDFDFECMSVFDPEYGFFLKNDNRIRFVVMTLNDFIDDSARTNKGSNVIIRDWYKGFNDERIRTEIIKKLPIKAIEICNPKVGFST